ncbi:hypothetical protein AX17_005539 [Amanita inopinata Kibby_2008]|nr:hypothetical protein AX17_005539 [Amanita inopinata Kibby_2008]
MQARDTQFNAIGDGIYIKRPHSEQQEHPGSEAQSPTIILLFGWMGAKLPHLQKYTNTYDRLYPSATQILVRCEASTFWTPAWLKRSTFHPAIEVLESLGCITSLNHKVNIPDGPNDSNVTKHRILVHTFSNGGCAQLTTLSKQLSSFKSINTTTSALIFDSCPGRGSLSSSKRAFASVIQITPLRLLFGLFLHLVYFIYGIRRRLFGIPSYWEGLRVQLNEPDLLPWLQKKSPRLYIYSMKDELIPWRDVESHAKDVEKWCLDVRREMFETSMHVAHMRQDPERYWGTVQGLWSAACNAHA